MLKLLVNKPKPVDQQLKRFDNRKMENINKEEIPVKVN